MNISGAQYEATYGLPWKMVWINGSPNARVLCDAQNMAATASLVVKPKTWREKRLKKAASESKCNVGKRVSKTTVCRTSSPNPVENALEKALKHIPRRIVYSSCV